MSRNNPTASQLAHLRYLCAVTDRGLDVIWERRYVYRGRYECTSHGYVTEWHAPVSTWAEQDRGDAPKRLNRRSMDRLVVLGLAEVEEVEEWTGSHTRTERTYRPTAAGRALVAA